MNPRIVFIGTPLIAAKTLLALVANKNRVVGVFTANDKPSGRGRKLAPNPVKQSAVNLGLPLFQADSINKPYVLDQLQQLSPDVFLVVAYGRILGRRALSLPKLGCYNLHYSLLPRWRGASPVQASLLNGDSQTGVSLIRMAAQLDQGAIISYQAMNIAEGITAGYLLDQLCELGIDLLLSSINKLDALVEKPQDSSKATYCGFINAKDCQINWDSPVKSIYRQWQAFSPRPGVYTFLDGQRFILSCIEVELYAHNLPAGQIIIDEKQLKIAASDGLVIVKRCKMSGRKEMKIEDFVKGLASTKINSLNKSLAS